MSEVRKMSKFTMIPGEMLGDSRLKSLDVVVYAALDSFVNRHGEAWPSIPLIAERAGVSQATVKRALARLENAGYIVRQRRYKPGTKEFDNTLYTLLFRRGEDSSGRTEDGSGGPEVGSPQCVRSALPVQEVGSESSSNYTHRTIPKEQEYIHAGEISPSHFEAGVSQPPPNDTKTGGAKPGTASVNADSDTVSRMDNAEKRFAELWERYPRKRARGEAKKAFMALFPPGNPPEEAERRLRTLEERFLTLDEEAQKLIARGEERYIPCLHNWLAREGFSDA